LREDLRRAAEILNQGKRSPHHHLGPGGGSGCRSRTEAS